MFRELENSYFPYDVYLLLECYSCVNILNTIAVSRIPNMYVMEKFLYAN